MVFLTRLKSNIIWRTFNNDLYPIHHQFKSWAKIQSFSQLYGIIYARLRSEALKKHLH